MNKFSAKLDIFTNKWPLSGIGESFRVYSLVGVSHDHS